MDDPATDRDDKPDGTDDELKPPSLGCGEAQAESQASHAGARAC